jgi:predicted metalloprotease
MRLRRKALIVTAALWAAPITLSAASAASALEAQRCEQLVQEVDQFWSRQIAELGGRYRPPKLVLFAHSTSGVCGIRQALSGPFYCPVNETVYLDTSYLQQVVQRGRGAGQLALGYVVAHEVAHHIQNIIGTTSIVEQARASSTAELARRTLASLELQADCYAGLWARAASTAGELGPSGDIAPALAAVAAVGAAQPAHRAAGPEVLDPLTHATEPQRLKWFRRGFDSGQFNDCDTFGAAAAGTL